MTPLPPIAVDYNSVAGAGSACDLLVSQANGKQRMVRVEVLTESRGYLCCGYPNPPYPGLWVEQKVRVFVPNRVVISDENDAGTDVPALDARSREVGEGN
jgi:hypothetical protein